MWWRDMVSKGPGTSRHAGLMPLDSLRSEWYLRAFRGGCDYGGSGQVLRAALWYHSVRLRCHHALVARRLLNLQFCVWVSAAVTRPGIPVPGLSVCALPSSFHSSPTPPRPPFQGGAGGGESVGAGWCARTPLGAGGKMLCGEQRGAIAPASCSCSIRVAATDRLWMLASPLMGFLQTSALACEEPAW